MRLGLAVGVHFITYSQKRPKYDFHAKYCQWIACFVKCGQILVMWKGFDGMIVTTRRTPDQLVYYDVMLRRGIGVESSLRDRYHNLRAGLAGERRVDREWKELNLSHYLFHDFTTVNGAGNTHQMDTVFVCKHFVLVVEVKNVGGRIDFDDQRRQFVRAREDGTVESFMNPVDQVKRHRDLLEQWSLEWPEYVPVEAAIVIANPSAVIGRVSAEVPIFNVSGLRTKVLELVRKYERVSFNMRAVRGYLEAMYRPVSWRVHTLDVPVRPGVLCLKCGEVMVHGQYRFECGRCGFKDREWEALNAAMQDYRVLYGDEVTNRKFREFTGVRSASTAKRMLKRLCEQKNATKGTVYCIPNVK